MGRLWVISAVGFAYLVTQAALLSAYLPKFKEEAWENVILGLMILGIGMGIKKRGES